MGSICEATRCVSPDGRCADIDACDAGAACVGGDCVSPVACNNNRDCRRLAAVFTCVAGVCRAPVVQCARNADCADGSSCVFGFCAPIRSPECVRDVDCVPGEVCDAERCVLAP
jgi:hypothetical protein